MKVNWKCIEKWARMLEQSQGAIKLRLFWKCFKNSPFSIIKVERIDRLNKPPPSLHHLHWGRPTHLSSLQNRHSSLLWASSEIRRLACVHCPALSTLRWLAASLSLRTQTYGLPPCLFTNAQEEMVLEVTKGAGLKFRLGSISCMPSTMSARDSFCSLY